MAEICLTVTRKESSWVKDIEMLFTNTELFFNTICHRIGALEHLRRSILPNLEWKEKKLSLVAPVIPRQIGDDIDAKRMFNFLRDERALNELCVQMINSYYLGFDQFSQALNEIDFSLFQRALKASRAIGQVLAAKDIRKYELTISSERNAVELNASQVFQLLDQRLLGSNCSSSRIIIRRATLTECQFETHIPQKLEHLAYLAQVEAALIEGYVVFLSPTLNFSRKLRENLLIDSIEVINRSFELNSHSWQAKI